MVMTVGVIVPVMLDGRAPPRRAERQILFDHVFCAALEDTTGAEHFLCRNFELVRATAHHHHFETVLAIEMNVHGRAHLLAHVVLQRGELLGKLTDVMIVNERDRGKSADAILERRAPHLGAREIAQELGTVTPASFGQLVDLGNEARLHRDPESNEALFRHGSQPSRSAGVRREQTA